MNSPQSAPHLSSGGATPQGAGWSRALLVALILLPAYYGSYVLWGRGMTNDAPLDGQWMVMRGLHEFWAPLRAWDEWVKRVRLARQFAGEWVSEDDGRLYIGLKPNGQGMVMIDDSGERTFVGRWTGLDTTDYFGFPLVVLKTANDTEVAIFSFEEGELTFVLNVPVSQVGLAREEWPEDWPEDWGEGNGQVMQPMGVFRREEEKKQADERGE